MPKARYGARSATIVFKKDRNVPTIRGVYLIKVGECRRHDMEREARLLSLKGQGASPTQGLSHIVFKKDSRVPTIRGVYLIKVGECRRHDMEHEVRLLSLKGQGASPTQVLRSYTFSKSFRDPSDVGLSHSTFSKSFRDPSSHNISAITPLTPKMGSAY